MSTSDEPNNTPESRESARSRLRNLTRGAVLAATGAAAVIGIVVANDHPGAGGTTRTTGSSGSTTAGTATSSGSSSAGTTGTTGNTGATTTTTTTPTVSSSTPSVTSGGTSQ